jgi:hypothetical protein
MSTVEINASGTTPLYQYVGQSGNVDRLIITINDNFKTSLTIETDASVGEIKTVEFIKPSGWRAELIGKSELAGMQPTWKSNSYHIFNDDGLSVGTICIRANSAPLTCFCKGTEILTNRGYLLVEKLRVGDFVATVDRGYKEVRRIDQKKLDKQKLKFKPYLRPIKFAAGSLGYKCPKLDFFVSPQQRVLVSSIVAERIFKNFDVLVPAKSFVGSTGVTIVEDETDIVYFHVMFDTHQLVFSSGCITEAYYFEKGADSSFSIEVRYEDLELLADHETGSNVQLSRRKLTEKDGKHLAARLNKNSKPVIESSERFFDKFPGSRQQTDVHDWCDILP